jgi:hypothetical protein
MSDLTRIRAERTGYRYDEGKPFIDSKPGFQ